MSIFTKSNRIISLLMALVMLLGAFSVVAVSAADALNDSSSDVISDGVYRIKNKATNKYIDTYDFYYDANGTAYLDYATGMNGQDFRVERSENGSYMIFALTEKVVCALGYGNGSFICKEKKIDDSVNFIIVPLTNGEYKISSASGDSDTMVLTASDKRSDYGHQLLSLLQDKNSDTQKWEFIKVKPTNITLSEYSTTVKPYTVGTLTATVAPLYITDEVTWKSSDESIVMVDSDGSYCALKEGIATVTATCAGVSVSCKINVTSVIAHSWFSQHNMYNGGWDALSLKGVYFYAGGRYKPFMIDQYNSNYDWMDEGCLVCCIAMLLRNMGATLDGAYDIRTGKTGSLQADPYTVALANAGSKGATSSNKTVYGNPIYVASNRIAEAFKLKGKSFEVNTTYYVTKKAIKEALDRHPEGVIVGFKKWNSSHYLLFTKCVNPQEKNPNNYQFIVCDPASYTGKDGDHVLFEKSYSYLTIGYRYSHAVAIEEWSLKK